MSRSASRSPRSTAAETRGKIVEAAAAVMHDLGLANATTKKIAKAAGYSEATLYKHFSDKEELFLHVLRDRFPPFVDVLARLPERAGEGDVRQNIADLLVMAVPFFRHGVPMLGSLFAEPELLARHREAMQRADAGPMNVNRLVGAYLDKEQRLGRVPADVASAAAASMLVGACFQRAFLEAFLEGAADFAELRTWADELAGTVLGPV